MKVNQRGEGRGRQSSPVVLRTIILMAMGLSLLFSGAAQGQIVYTNVLSGNWSSGSSWYGTGPSSGGSNMWTIMFTNIASDASVNNLGTFQLNQLIFAPPAYPVTLTGSGLEFAYASSNVDIYDGTTNTLNALPQLLQNSTNLMTINVGVKLDTNMTFAGTGSGGVTIGSSISQIGGGVVQLTMNGPYILTLSSANSYTGGTVISNGVMAFAAGAVPGSGVITVTSPGTVWFKDGTFPPTSLLSRSSSGGLAIGSGNATSNANFQTAGLTNMSLVAAESFTYGAVYTPFTNSYNYGAMAGVTLTISNNLPDLSLPTSLVIGPGGGMVVLTGTNTYTGGTTIGAGTLYVSSDTNLGASSSLVLTNGGTLEVTNSFTLNNRPVAVNAPGGGGISVDLLLTLTIYNVISGTGPLTKSGAGWLWLTGTNTLSGTTTINTGKVVLASGLILTNSPVVINVDYGLIVTNGDKTWVLGGLGGGNAIKLTNGTSATTGAVTNLILGADNGAVVNYSTNLYDTAMVKLVKNGTNTQIFSGTNTFNASESIVINSGVLEYSSSNAFGRAVASAGVKPFVINYGGALALGYPFNSTFIGNGINVAIAPTGTIALASDNPNSISFASYPGLSLGAAGAGTNYVYSGTLTVVTVGGTNMYLLGGGGGTLTLTNLSALASPASVCIGCKGSGGAVAITADNTYYGDTTVSNSTLDVSNDNSVNSKGSSATAPGTSPVGGGTIMLVGSTLTLGNFIPANPGVSVDGATFINVVGYSNQAFNGLSGGGIMSINTLSPTNPGVYTDLALPGAYGGMGFTGTFVLVGNSILRSARPQSIGASNAMLDCGTGRGGFTATTENPGTLHLGAISSSSTGTFIQSRTDAGIGTRLDTYVIGWRNTNVTFAGRILNGGPGVGMAAATQLGIIYVGSNSVWTLTGITMLDQNTNSFSGGMTISNGTVVVTPTATSTNYGGGSNGNADGGPSRNVWTVVSPNAGLMFSTVTNFAGNPTFAIGALAGTSNLGLTNVVGGAGITLRINSGPYLNTVYSGNLTGDCNSVLIKEGPGVLTLSGTNTYCGGTYIYGGIVGFASDASFPASGPLSVASGTSVGLFLTNVANALSRLDPGTAGGIAVSSNSANADVNFATGGIGGLGITNAWFVAGQTLTYGGTFTPLTNVFRLGANAGATFYYTNAINDVAGWAPSTLYIGPFGGGTVALFPNPGVITNGLTWSTNNCGWIRTNAVTTNIVMVIVTNNYSGGTFVSGDTNGWSPLYIGADVNLGQPGGGLTLSNGDLVATNTFTLNNRPIVLKNASGIGVDPFSTLTVTNVISGTGPLTKYGAGVLVLGTNNSFTGGTIVNGGVLAYGNANAVPTDNSVTVTNGAVGFQFSGVQARLGAAIANGAGSTPNVGGVALFAMNANEDFNFGATAPGANLEEMSLVAAENLTYSGTYTPWDHGAGEGAGGRYRIGAMAGVTLTYTNTIADAIDGSSWLVIGGFNGGYSGTVVLEGNNTYSGDNARIDFGAATTVMGGTLYITNDAALGAPGDGAYLPHGGLMMSNATLMTTNSITLNNRVVQLFGNTTINVQPGSVLAITNVLNILTNWVTAISLTKTNNGLLILSGTNNVPAGPTCLSVYINGGVLRATPGAGINFFPPTGSGTESNSIVQINGGVWDVVFVGQAGAAYMTNRVTNFQRSGGVSFPGGRSGLSARTSPLIVWFGTDSNATDQTLSPSMVSTQHWGGGTGTPFNPSTFVLNEFTADHNLTWMTHIDLNAALNRVTGRTIDVSATNPLVTKIVGCIMNTTSTNNTPGPYPVLNATNAIATLTKTGIGTLQLDGTNSYNGATTINQGTLIIGNDLADPNLGSIGSITNSMYIVVGNSTNGATFDVSQVAPYYIGLNTNQTLAGGPGTVIGDVILTNLDTLAPGDTASSTNFLMCACYYGCGTNTLTNAIPVLSSRVGTLTFSNNLTVASTLVYDLGTNSDLVIVAGNLTVGGKLNIRDSGGFGNGTYTLFQYGGALTYNGITTGTVPNASLTYVVDTSSNGLVRLNVSGGAPPCTSPWANFSANTTSGAPNLQVIFTDASTGTMNNVYWTFGDGNSATNSGTPTMPYSVTNTYTTAGHYPVTEIVDGGSCGISTNVQPNLIWVYSAWEAWQQQYFNCVGCSQAAGNLDFDGDGISNTNEFLAGTDPTNPLSALRIISVVRQASTNIVITWNAVGGKSYYVQTNAPPVNGSYINNFSDLSSVINVTGIGPTTAVYTNWGGATHVPALYYRIRLGP